MKALAIVTWLGWLTYATAAASSLSVRLYSTAEGLRGNSVNRIVADSHGFLWLCTSDGVSRFDGASFLNFGVRDGLHNRRVNDFLETRSGDFWVATAAGLTRLKIKTGEELPQTFFPPGTSWISRLLEVRQAGRETSLWVGTDAGLFRFTPGNQSFEPIALGAGGAANQNVFIRDLLEEPDQTLWVATDRGLYCLKDGVTRQHYGVADGLPGGQVSGITRNADGAMWAATWHGVARISKNRVDRVLTVSNGLTGDYLNSLLSLPDGRTWLAGVGGVTVIDAAGRIERTIRAKDGLAVDDVESLALDPSGNVWIGTDGAGAAKVAQTGFTTFTQQDGIVGRVAAFVRSQAGEAVLFTKQENTLRIYVWQPDRFELVRRLQSPQKFGWGTGQIAFHGAKREWWIADAGGLYRFRPSSAVAELKNLQPALMLKGTAEKPAPVRAFEDSRGDVWLGFRRRGEPALMRWDQHTSALMAIDPEQNSGMISFPFTFAEDRAGNVWIGYFQGSLWRYCGGRLREADLPETARRGIRSLLVDSKGRLWIGTSEAGLLRIDDPTAQHPVLAQPAAEKAVSGDLIKCLAEDAIGHIYACTELGVDELDPVSESLRHYSTQDGLVKGDLEVALRDKDGAMWFGSSQGISRLVRRMGSRTQGPYIQINRLEIGGISQRIPRLGQPRVTDLTVPYGSPLLRIDVIAPTLWPGDILRYQTRLEGADREWSEAANGSVSYAALRPGSYRFLARAVTSEGLASPIPAEVDFLVPRPYWEQWWFISSSAFALVLATFWAHRARLARAVEVERVRNRIAQDLHDDIGASLSQISVLSEVARLESGEGAQAPLGRVSELAGQVLESMSDIVWAIHPKRDRSGDLIQRMRYFAAELFTAAQIELTFGVDVVNSARLYHPELRRELLLMFKEAVNNVVKHAAAQHVAVIVKAGQRHFEFSVCDDGRGFDRPALKAGGNGLPGLEWRAGRLGGQCQVLSRPEAGTTVRVLVPLRKKFRTT